MRALAAIGFSINLMLAVPFTSLQTPVLSKLRKPDQARLAGGYAGGASEVMVLIAAKSGTSISVSHEIERLGGEIRYREDSVDYLRVKLPIGAVETIARLENIESLNVGDDLQYFSSAFGSSAEAASPEVPNNKTSQASHDSIQIPGPDTPAENPYVPTMYIGGPQFLAKHPTFDGRGVVIALIDGFPDILHPVFQSAKTLDGKPTRKFVDLRLAIDPRDFGFDARFFVNMAERVNASDGRGHSNRFVQCGDQCRSLYS